MSFYSKVAFALFFVLLSSNTLVVQAQSNQKPIINSSPVTAINDSELYRYEVTATDADGDFIELSATNLPVWLRFCQFCEGTVTTFTGATFGSNDGPANSAGFNDPRDPVFDQDGNMYVADFTNYRIRKITPDGTVSTLAGSTNGFQNGQGSDARFGLIISLVIDDDGNLYAGDLDNNRIRKITPDGTVSDFVGDGNRVNREGVGTGASLGSIRDMVRDHQGDIYVVSQGEVFKITPDAKVTLFLSTDQSDVAGQIGYIGSIEIDKEGNLYFEDGAVIKKLSPQREISTIAGNGSLVATDGPALEAGFAGIQDIVLDDFGNIFVADHNAGLVRVITTDGWVYTLAGGGPQFSLANGVGSEANFSNMWSIGIDKENNLYVPSAPFIKKISFPYALLRGNPEHQSGAYDITLKANDGNGEEATQEFTITVTDNTAPEIASIERTMPLLAGISPVSADFKVTFTEEVENVDASDFEVTAGGTTGNITAVAAGINEQTYLVTVTLGQVNGVLDLDLSAGNDVVDKAGKNITNLVPAYEEVYDYANQAPTLDADVPSELFAGQKLDVPLKTTDAENHVVDISEVSLPDWLSIRPPAVSTIIGSESAGEVDGRELASLQSPTGATMDDDGNLYILGNSKIRKVTPDGYMSTLVGAEAGDVDGNAEIARFNAPSFIYYAPDGFLYVTGILTDKIKRVSLTGEVTTFAGSVEGSADGDLNTATFNAPRSIRFHDGKFYLSDKNGLRTIDSDGNVTTLNLVDEDSNPFSFTEIVAFAIHSDGTIYATDINSNKIYRIGTDLKVSVIAGSTVGDQDGIGLEAQFGSIASLELDHQGNLYIGDGTFRKVKRLDNQYRVTTIAGSVAGYLDGPASEARFQSVSDLYYAADGYLVICDWSNRRIRKLELIPSLYGTVPDGLTNGTISGTLGLTDPLGASRNVGLSFDIVSTDKPEFSTGEFVFFAEGGNGIALMPNLTNPGNVTFSLGESADVELFSINEKSGEVVFKQTPDFEQPADADSDNIYRIKIVASRGKFSAKKEIGIVVTNINDHAPVFVSEPVTRVTDLGYYSYEIDVSDADGDSLSFANSTIPAWLSLGRKTTANVSTIAGNGQKSSEDGLGTMATFNNPVSVHYAASGDLFVAENGGNRIRKIDARGNVTTVAGTGEFSSVDGDVSSATIRNPLAVTTDKLGNIYVVGSEHRLRKITPDGIVSTLAGNGQAGYQDGLGSEAQFNSPAGIVADKANNLYIADQSNNRIRKVTPAGEVTTFAGSGQAGFTDGTGTAASFRSPRGLALDEQGNLYVADQGNHLIRKITPAGVVTTVAGATDVSVFHFPISVAVDKVGNIFVGDFFNFQIKKVDINGNVTTLAGSGSGFKDGRSSEAEFSGPVGLSIDPDNNLYVADVTNSRIRKLSGTYCLEGDPTGQVGVHDITLNAADKGSLSANQTFRLSVLNSAIPHFDSESLVEFEENSTEPVFVPTLLDKPQANFSLKSEQDGTQFTINPIDGELRFASAPDFETPTDQNGDNIYNITLVATIGSETAEHNLAVSVLNLNENDPQFDSNPVTSVADNAQYNYQIQVSDPDGDLVEVSVSTLPDWLKLDPGSLTVTNLAGSTNSGLVNGTGTAASFNFASGLLLDTAGNVFVADYDTHTIRKITPAGEVTTFAGSGNRGYAEGNGTAASFSEPSGLTMDRSGNLYLADFNGHVILKITPAADVTFFAGVPDQSGYVDGSLAESRFSIPIEIAIDNNDNLYVADYNNHVIRKITPDGQVSTLAGSGNRGFVDGLGTAASFSSPSDMVVDDEGNVYVADGGNNAIRKITPEGLVTTIAGSGTRGSEDGLGTAAEFAFPSGIAIDIDGSLLVADSGNKKIRRVTLDGKVTSIVGSGLSKEEDGIGLNASFGGMIDVVSDGKGGMIISTGSTNTIRRVTLTQPVLSGDATGLSGSSSVTLNVSDPGGNQATQSFNITISDATAPAFNSPTSVDFTENGTLAAYESKVEDTGILSFSLGTGKDEDKFEISSWSGLVFFKSPPDFESPTDADADNVYEIEIIVSDGTNQASQMVSITVTDIADESLAFTSTPQTEVARKDFYQYVIEAQKSSPGNPEISTTDLPDWLSFQKQAKVASIPGKGIYIASDKQGNLYTADLSRIWKITADGTVSLLAGGDQPGYQDGTGTEARFSVPQGLAVGPDGNLYVADSRNNRIRKVTPAGVVTTYAGKQTDGWEHVNGSLLDAAFAWPSGLVFDPDGNLFVADTRSHTIRKIGIDGQVTTVAGKLNPTFLDRGAGLRFFDYAGAYADGAAADAQFNWPWGISIDSNGNLFVTDRNNNYIRKVGIDGQVTTLLKNDDRFGRETSQTLGLDAITIDDEDNILFAADGAGIFRITPSEEITQLAFDNSSDPIDGVGRDVSFFGIDDIVIHNDGFIYIPDDYHELLRKISLVDVIDGDPFEHVGAYDIKLSASDNTNSVDQNYTLTVTDDVAPEILEILRYNPATEVVRTDEVTFLVKFSEPVNNVTASTFTFDKSQLLGDISEVLMLNDSTFQVSINNIEGFGDLVLDLIESHGVVDAHGVALSTDRPDKEEQYTITVNAAPVFNSEPIVSVADNETYRYQLEATDTNYDTVNITAPTLPDWLELGVSQYEVSNFAGNSLGGFAEGTGEEASFSFLVGLSINKQGIVHTLSQHGNNLRRINQSRTASGVIVSFMRTTLVSGGSGSIQSAMWPNRVLEGQDGHLYVTTGRFGTIEKVDPLGNRVTFAGSEPGFVNGSVTSAQFNDPRGMAFDADGNLYVADTGNDAIRKITPAGVVTTFAGGTKGYLDGNVGTAQFNAPYDLDFDAEGNLFVADTGNDRVRKIAKDGTVTTVAGSGDFEGSGPALESGFVEIRAITFDDQGDLFIVDGYHNGIRVLDQNGMITPLVTVDEEGQAVEPFEPGDMVFGKNGEIYVLEDATRVLKLRPLRELIGEARGQSGTHEVRLMAIDEWGEEDYQSFTISIEDKTIPILDQVTRLLPTTESTSLTSVTFHLAFTEPVKNLDASDLMIQSNTVTGQVMEVYPLAKENEWGAVVTGLSGLGSYSLALKSEADIYDMGNNALDASQVPVINESYTRTNVAPQFVSDAITRPTSSTTYSYPIVVADADCDALSVTADGLPAWLSLSTVMQVSTFAGNGDMGSANGTGPDARFSSPVDVVVDSQGNIYVADRANNSIRKITPEGVVTDFAGSSQNVGFQNGNLSAATFSGPTSLAIDPQDNVYLIDEGNFAIRKISSEGMVTTVAGGTEGYQDGQGTAARFAGPKHLAIDSDGNLYLFDIQNEGANSFVRFRKIDASGDVTTMAGAEVNYLDGPLANARFHDPTALVIDSNDNLFFAEGSFGVIRKISAAGKVSTVAGTGNSGYQDGSALQAQFDKPTALAIDRQSSLIIGEEDNSRIRKMDKAGVVSTLAGNGALALKDGSGGESSFNAPLGLAVNAQNLVFVADAQNHAIRQLSFATTLQGDPSQGEESTSITLKVSDGQGGEDTQTFTIAQDFTPPVYTAPLTATVAEGTTESFYTATATDVAEVTYSLGANADEEFFEIGSADGQLKFRESPDFENPADADNANTYELAIIVSDGFNETMGNITVTVTDVSDFSPGFVTEPITTIREDEIYTYTPMAIDADGDQVTMTATLPDWLTSAQSEGAKVESFAGSFISTLAAGFAPFTSYFNPSGVFVADNGDVYIADTYHHMVRVLSPDQQERIIAGSGVPAFADGEFVGASFNRPTDLILDADGNIYVTDKGNHSIRKVTPDGVVTTLAGNGESGSADGTGADARFNEPEGLDIDPDGNLIVADMGNRLIRKVTPDGVVTTIDLSGQSVILLQPMGLAVADNGEIFISDAQDLKIKKISTTGDLSVLAGSGTRASTDGNGTSASFVSIGHIDVDASNNVYITQFALTAGVRKIDAQGEVTTILGPVGTAPVKTTDLGRFLPVGLAVGNDGDMIITEWADGRIIKFEPGVQATKIAGGFSNTPTGGLKTEATFNRPVDGAFDNQGNLYVVDRENHRIRKIQPDGQVVPFAGSGTEATIDGNGFAAAFNRPVSIVIDSQGNLFVSELSGQVIRKITPDGTVTTFAGSGTGGFADGIGTAAQFQSPAHMLIDDEDNIFLVDGGNNRIRMITPDAEVTTLAGNGVWQAVDGAALQASFGQPQGIAFDLDGNLLVADGGNNLIRLISKDGQVSTLAGSGQFKNEDGNGTAASFKNPQDIVVDPKGNIYVLSGSTIRLITSDGTVTTFAGAEQEAFKDAVGTEARFNRPEGLLVDPNGKLLIFDAENHRIRSMTLAGTTISGDPTGHVGTHDVVILAEDADNNQVEQAFIIEVLDVTSPVFTSENEITVAENTEGTVYTATTTDQTTVTYELVQRGPNTDEPLFTIEASTGELSFKSAPDFESPADEDADNTYVVLILAKDVADNRELFLLSLSVTNASEFAPEFTSTAVTSVTETELYAYTIGMSDQDGDDITLTADLPDWLTLETITANQEGSLTGDPKGQVGTYDIVLTLEDATGEKTTQEFTLTVADATAPVFTSATAAEYAEKGTGTAYTATTTDDSAVSYDLGTGNDEGLFSIDSQSGEVNFLNSPDFDNPVDGNGDNDYVLLIKATDARGNASEQTVTISILEVDETAPTVTITSEEDNITNNSPVIFKVTVSETVIGFEEDDLSVNNATVSGFTQVGNEFEVSLEPIADGEISLQVPAEVFTDEAGNNNEASNVFGLISDRSSPEALVTLTGGSITNAEELELTITVSETTTDLTQDDLSIDNATVSAFSADGLTYSVTLLPTEDGQVKLSVPQGVFTDVAGNANTASNEVTVTVDRTKPVVSITSEQGELTNAASLVYNISLSEVVTEFTTASVTVQNGSIESLTGSDLAYVLTVTPAADGHVIVTTSDEIEDEAGNQAESEVFESTSDRTAPIPVLSSESTDEIDAPFSLKITYSELVSGFELSDLSVENGEASELTAIEANKEWTVTISPEANGPVKVDLVSGSATDAAGNPSEAATQFEIVYNLNRAPTGVGLSNNMVDENNDPDLEVGVLSAVDPDEGDSHTFALVTGVNSDDNDQFSIDGDRLIANVSFDFETKSQYRIRVQATDEQGETVEGAFLISINNLPEPQINLTGDLAFGTVDINTTAQLSFNIENTGDGQLTVTNLSLPSGFTTDYSGGTIAANASQEVTVTFSPIENIAYSGTLTVESDAGTESLPVSGTGQLVTSIDDDIVLAEEINLYPNPASQRISIDLKAFNGRPVDLYLYDLTGRLRKAVMGIRDSKVSLDVSKFEEGTFMIRLQDKSQQVMKKMMIKR